MAVNRRWGASAMVAAGCGVSAMWCAAVAVGYDWAAPFNYACWWTPLALWPSWLFGAWLAERHQAGRPGFRRPAVTGILAAGLTVAVSFSKPGYAALAFNLAALAAACLTDAYLRAGRSAGPAARLLAFVGLCSYSVYLVHQQLIRPFLDACPVAPAAAQMAVGLPAFTALVVTLAWALYRTVERGGIRIAQRLSRTPAHPR